MIKLSLPSLPYNKTYITGTAIIKETLTNLIITHEQIQGQMLKENALIFFSICMHMVTALDKRMFAHVLN